MKRRTCIKEKGITLIALVITIIIMLILAGVIISSVTSNKGILSRAKDSREVYDESKAEEQVRLLMNEYAMASAEAGTKGETLTLEDYLKEKKADGTITEYEVKSDGSSTITIGDKTINVNKDLSVADNTNKVGDSSSTTGKITYTDTTDNTQKPLTKDTAAGTKIGTTENIDGQSLDWYLFDVSDDGKTAYLVSTPTYWVPDTTKEVRGAWAPKLVSAKDSNTGAIRQAIQKKASGTAYNNYTYSSGDVTYKPSDNTLNYYKSVNSQWSAQRGNIDLAKDEFKTKLNENEQAAFYLADGDIFAGIKDQVNNADGNLKGEIQTLVGGASAEQWCKAYNKQSVASSSKITCEYSTVGWNNATVPGYIYKVNGTAQNSGWYTNNKTIVGNDIYGAAYTNGNTSSSNPFYNNSWWWLASPSSRNSFNVCYVAGSSSNLGGSNSYGYTNRFSLFASVSL